MATGDAVATQRDGVRQPQAAAEPQQDVVQPERRSASTPWSASARCSAANASAFATSSRWITASTPLSPSRTWGRSCQRVVRTSSGNEVGTAVVQRRGDVLGGRRASARAARSGGGARRRCRARPARRTRRPGAPRSARPAARSTTASASGRTSSRTALHRRPGVRVEPAVQALGGEDVGLAERAGPTAAGGRTARSRRPGARTHRPVAGVGGAEVQRPPSAGVPEDGGQRGVQGIGSGPALGRTSAASVIASIRRSTRPLGG